MGTCLLDLYPEVEEKVGSATAVYIPRDSAYKDYPFSESIMVFGFFLVLIIEQVVLAYKERDETYELVEAPLAEPKNSPKRASNSASSSETDPLLERSMEYRERPRSVSMSSTRSLNTISDRPVSSPNSGHDQSMHQDPSSHSPVRSIIMLAALSLHSVFEGLAVGLQETVAQVMAIFGALILHKCIIAFSIGLNLIQSKLAVKAMIVSNAVFCIASPIGIGIGILVDEVTSQSTELSMTSGILQGIACGTFLYVTFFEVLPHEFNRPSDRILKLLFVIIGFIVVNGMILLELKVTT